MAEASTFSPNTPRQISFSHNNPHMPLNSLRSGPITHTCLSTLSGPVHFPSSSFLLGFYYFYVFWLLSFDAFNFFFLF